MKKKIIIVTKALWIGGIETALVNLLNSINYTNYDVTLLVLHAELNLIERINPNCRVIIIDREKNYSFEKKYKYKKLYYLTQESVNPSRLHKAMMWSVPLIKWIENRLYIAYVRSLMKQEQFDDAIIYSDVVAETAIRAIRARNYIMFYHHGGMRHVYHDKIAYKKCKYIVAVSENQATELKSFVPNASDKVVTIHNCTNAKEVVEKSLSDTEEVFDKSKFNIVTVGRVAFEKGMDLAIQACEELIKSGQSDIRWWIVGNGPVMNEIHTLIEQKNLQDYVVCVGMKENPYPYIRKADLYVQPSRVESFGLTIMEALFIGKPIVSTCTSGAKELLNGSNLGIICDIDAKDMAAKIMEMRKGYSKFSKKSIVSFDYSNENREQMDRLEQLL